MTRINQNIRPHTDDEQLSFAADFYKNHVEPFNENLDYIKRHRKDDCLNKTSTTLIKNFCVNDPLNRKLAVALAICQTRFGKNVFGENISKYGIISLENWIREHLSPQTALTIDFERASNSTDMLNPAMRPYYAIYIYNHLNFYYPKDFPVDWDICYLLDGYKESFEDPVIDWGIKEPDGTTIWDIEIS